VADYWQFIQEWMQATLARHGVSWSVVYFYWVAIQAAVFFGCFVLARLVGRIVEPRLEAPLREIKGAPRLLRLLAVLLRRISPITLTVLLWIAVLVMRELTWPSRSYLLFVAASLVTAWVAIAIVSRVIRNRAVANVVASVAWGVAALNILGVLYETLAVLDAIAIDVKGLHLSVLLVLKSVAILSVLTWLALGIGRFAERRIAAMDELTPSLKVLVVKLARAALLVTALLLGLTAVGIDITTLAVFSGAVGLGLGFGLQKVASNLVSGFILLLDKSIKPGDVITVGDTFGTVNAMGARHVSVIARDGREYLIPNEDLITNQVLNWSYSSDLVRIDLHFGASYDADPHLVREVAKQAAVSQARVVAEPPPVCHITEFGDSSIDYIVRFWIRDPSRGVTNVRGDMFLTLWDLLKENGVKIPYPHREVIMHTPIEAATKAPRRAKT
jgi:small-conductance mechanosensitive channel